MKKNVGNYDRAIRLLLAIGFLIVAVVHLVPGNWNIVTWIVAGILFLTALFGICPIYGVCNIDTRTHNKTDAFE